MKTPRTYRIIALLIMALAVSPILSYSTAHAMAMGDPAQQQTDMTASTKCHQTSEKQDCKHCAASTDSSCCENQSGSTCNTSCGHVVVSATISIHLFDAPLFQQENIASIKQLTLSIDPDTRLRPPQFA